MLPDTAIGQAAFHLQGWVMATLKSDIDGYSGCVCRFPPAVRMRGLRIDRGSVTGSKYAQPARKPVLDLRSLTCGQTTWVSWYGSSNSGLG